MYYEGQTVTLSVAIARAGVPVDPSALTLEITRPDGVLVTEAYGGAVVERDGVGAFHADVTLSARKIWSYRWLATTAFGTGVTRGSIRVAP